MNLAAEFCELWSVGTSLVYVVTSEEERAVTLCQSAAQTFKAAAAVWSSHRGLSPLAPQARAPLAAIDAILEARSPIVAVMLDFHLALEDPLVARRVRDIAFRLAAERRCLAIVAPRLCLPEGLAQHAAVLRLPLPGEKELAAVLEGAMARARGAAADADRRHRAVSAALGLGESQARRAFLRALRADPALGERGVAAVVKEKTRILARDVGLELVESSERAEDVGGLEGLKAWMAERALAFAPDARRFGLPAPRGVMLLGVQGCGKSLASKMAAAQLGVPLLRLDLPRVLGAGDGAEENLARALEAAEANAPLALWVDEIEKAFAGSAPGQGGDARAARLLGAFSTWLQERSTAVFVVATANDVTRLPPELLRRGRFDELFFVDLPDLEARKEILAVHLRKRGRDPEKYDLVGLARLCADYSGAELEQVVVGALHRAYALRRDVEVQDLRRVAQDLVPLYRTYEESIKALRARPRSHRGAGGGGGGSLSKSVRRGPYPEVSAGRRTGPGACSMDHPR